MSESKLTKCQMHDPIRWKVGVVLPAIALAVVGCGPPILTGMHPETAKTTVWVGVKGAVSGWDTGSIQDSITQDGAVPLVQTFPANASVNVLDSALSTYHASLYVWIQDEPTDNALAQVAASHPNEKLEVVAPQSSGLDKMARVRTPDGNQVGYLLGYAAGLLATDIGQNQVGILSDAKSAVPQSEIEAMLAGLNSAGNVLSVLQANLSQNQTGQPSPYPAAGTNTVQSSNNASGTNMTGPSNPQGNVPGLSGFIPVPVTRVVLALRPLTEAEWKLALTNGIFVLSLVGDTKGPELVGEPLTPSFPAVADDIAGIVSGKWTTGSVSAVSASPVWFQPSAFTASTMTALNNLEQTTPTSAQILQRWNALPSTLRGQWAVWVNTGT